MTTRCLFLFTLLLFSQLGRGQTRTHRWGVGIMPVAYLFLDAPDRNPGIPADYDLGIGLSINRYLNSSFECNLDVSVANLLHPSEPAQADGSFDRNLFLETNVRVRYSFANGYLLKEEATLAPYLHAGAGFYQAASADQLQWHFPTGIGLRVRMDQTWHYFLESSFHIGAGDFGSYIQHSTGVIFSFRMSKPKPWEEVLADLDKDGIPDLQDQCPEIRGSKKGNGCPDRDGDGVFDDVDECPDSFGYANLAGCNDQDGDGIIDSDDFCPEVFGSFERRGCPMLDQDNDQIPDDEDDCPELAGHFSASGCPDADGDGVLDEEDSCPYIFGSLGFKGCPFEEKRMEQLDSTLLQELEEPVKQQLSNSNADQGGTRKGDNTPDCQSGEFVTNEVARAIKFESNRSAFIKDTYIGMERLLRFLEHCPNSSLVISVEPEDGDPMFTNTMAYSRALKIKSWLEVRGIEGQRLTAIRPTASKSLDAATVTLEFSNE